MLKWKRWIPAASAVILLLSAIPFLGRLPWFDEVLTIGWLRFDLSRIPFLYNIPNNHIVYTMLLWIWSEGFAAFGNDTLPVLRSLSLICGCGALFLISRYLLAHCGLLAGLCCSFLLAVSGTMSLFSTALRGYAFALLFCFAAFLAAGRWSRRRILDWNGLLYFLFCYLAVGVMPTDLFALEAGVLFFLPLLFRSRKDLLHLLLLAAIPVAALLLFYAHIFDKLLKTSQLREGWFSWTDTYWNLYGTWCFLFLPVLCFSLWGAVILWRKHRNLRLRLLCFLGIFLMPLLLGIAAQVPPFPRVFFPFFGIWSVILGICLIPLGRMKKPCLHAILLLISLLWIVLAASITPEVSQRMFGAHRFDDLLHSYPVSGEFRPDQTAEAIRKIIGERSVFIDFDADPPSLSMVLVAGGFPEDRILYDRPDFGRVIRLEPSDLIVCGDENALERLRERFSLKGEYVLVFDKAMQKIYQRKDEADGKGMTP